MSEIIEIRVCVNCKGLFFVKYPSSKMCCSLKCSEEILKKLDEMEKKWKKK